MTGPIVPALDDIAFDALVEEARGLIPRFAPDWTDHNLHDPGITIVELLAFLVDQQIYRIGMVGPSLERAFARLMGIAARPARSARFDIWPAPGAGLPVLDLERLTAISSLDLPDGRFMLDADMRSVAARISDIRLIDGDGRAKPHGTGLVEGRETLALMPPDGGGPEMLEIAFDRPFAEFDGAGPVSLGFLIEDGAAEADWGSLRIEQIRPGGTWREVAVEDRTHGLCRSGVVLIRADGGPRLRLRLDRSFRPGPVTIARIGLNVLPAREGWQDIERVVGTGNGLPDQGFDFPTSDIVAEETPLVIESAGAGGPEVWTPVADFAASGPGDRHLVLDPEDGTLRLGNGVNGAVLTEGLQLSHRPLIRCAGAKGNVAKGIRWRVAGLDWGENPEPGRGGRSRDRLDDLIRRAKASAGLRHGALGADTLEGMAAAAGMKLGRLHVAAGWRPGAPANGSRTVVAIPDRAAEAPPEGPRADVAEALGAALAPARLMGERLFVSTPIYLPVDVAVTLVLEADADAPAVAAEAEALIRARLRDLPTPGRDVVPWTPGRPLGPGDIRALMARLPDVLRMTGCTIAPGDGRAMADGLFPMADREIPMARRVTVATEAAP